MQSAPEPPQTDTYLTENCAKETPILVPGSLKLRRCIALELVGDGGCTWSTVLVSHAGGLIGALSVFFPPYPVRTLSCSLCSPFTTVICALSGFLPTAVGQPPTTLLNHEVPSVNHELSGAQ